MKKRRKPRGIKQDGTRSQNMYPSCLCFKCDPLHSMIRSRARIKIEKRQEQGLCPACGTNPL